MGGRVSENAPYPTGGEKNTKKAKFKRTRPFRKVGPRGRQGKQLTESGEGSS